MIQGTMSNAGKSIIVAGLCRMFKQDGYSVAPFKSQNMALNSYITKDKLEMGRAQVVQAEACRIEPEVDMNPILLKPTGNMSSQVIVNGKVIGDMRAVQYFKHKKEYIPAIMEAYNRLSNKYDIIVIEGAGSPAEINLKSDDIVNMGLAELVDAPVLLVGDIDRGGVFAQLIGTIMLLEEAERNRVKGLIINKFRGDKTILDPGIDMLEERADKKVIGVVPYADVDIEDEDSLAEVLNNKQIGEYIDIAVIRLPRISNFTDFQALAAEKKVNVRYVTKPSELGNPDVVILPGTKNTMGDLKWLRENGLEAKILRLAADNTLVCGICGGYQMLGESITDECNAEEFKGNMRGLGLLPIRTVFFGEKTRSRVDGRIGHISGELSVLSELEVTGYEIHMGRTELLENTINSLVTLQDKTDGAVKDNIFGTYLHGIFDHEGFRNGFVKMLCDKKGISYDDNDSFSYKEYKESQYDKLADILRDSLDMDEIYRIMGIDRN